MDEDITVRAITIGVSVFIAVITISLVLTYYNTARQAAQSAGTGIETNGYSDNINTLLAKNNRTNALTGTDAKNLISYFYGEPTVEITVKNLAYIGELGDFEYANTSGTHSSYVNINNDRYKYNNAMKLIISNHAYTLNYVDNGNRLVIELVGKTI